MASSENDSASALDLAARTIDLVSTIANASSKTHPLLSGILEIGEWLGREKLSRFALQDCLEKSKGLAITNATGQDLFEVILKRGNNLSVGQLFLRKSGSLGLLLARDPHLRWMVSTVACLFQFTNEEKFVTEAVCDYILRAHAEKEQSDRSIITLDLHPIRIQLKAVLNKMISSIWLNIVNSGQYNVKLPGELMDVCTRGHNLDSKQFSEIAIKLRNPHSRVIVRSKHFLRNLSLWLLHHFHGKFQVGVSGKIVYKTILGPEDREIDMRVDTHCPIHEACEGADSVVEVLIDIEGRLESVMSTRCSNKRRESLYNGCGTRQQLYTLPISLRSDGFDATKAFLVQVRSAAQGIVQWILFQEVGEADLNAKDLSFKILRHRYDEYMSQSGPVRSRKVLHSVEDLLCCSPKIINFDWDDPRNNKARQSRNWGEDRIAQFRFHNGYQGQRDTSTRRKIQGRVYKDNYDRLERIVQGFPVLYDLVQTFKRYCFCSLCAHEQQYPGIAVDGMITTDSEFTIEDGLFDFRDGCLKTEGLKAVFILIGHAIADGMGCVDASGSRSSDEIFDGTIVILDELTQGRPRIAWRNWFHLAATVTLGCPFKHRYSSEDQGSATIGIQYGSIALVASWLDMSSRYMLLKKCFSVTELRDGKLGIKSDLQNADGTPHFVCIQDDFAILQTELTQGTAPYREAMFPKDPLPQQNSTDIPIDTSPVESHMFLLSVQEGLYRVLVRIQSKNYSRFVDPTDAVLANGFGFHLSSCSHEHVPGLPSLSMPPNSPPVLLYSFDELLGQWPARAGGEDSPPVDGSDSSSSTSSEDTPDNLPFPGSQSSQKMLTDLHVTQYLDTPLKVNVARALAVCNFPAVEDRPICAYCFHQQGTSHIINGAIDMFVSKKDQIVVTR